MNEQTNRAEMLDRINTLMATGALPFAILLVLDALVAGGVGSALIDILGWVAKGLLIVVMVLLAISIFRKWRAVSPSHNEESYSAAMLLKAMGASWIATFVLLTQFDSLFQEPGMLGMVILPLVHAGEIVAAFMLAVFSLTYLGLMLASDSETPELRP